MRLSRIVVSEQSQAAHGRSLSWCARSGSCKRRSGARMVASESRPESSVVAEVRPSPNPSERKGGGAPDMIVLHYTGMPDDQAAIRQLCNSSSEVSAHYVVLPDGYI